MTSLIRGSFLSLFGCFMLNYFFYANGHTEFLPKESRDQVNRVVYEILDRLNQLFQGVGGVPVGVLSHTLGLGEDLGDSAKNFLGGILRSLHGGANLTADQARSLLNILGVRSILELPLQTILSLGRYINITEIFIVEQEIKSNWTDVDSSSP